MLFVETYRLREKRWNKSISIYYSDSVFCVLPLVGNHWALSYLQPSESSSWKASVQRRKLLRVEHSEWTNSGSLYVEMLSKYAVGHSWDFSVGSLPLIFLHRPFLAQNLAYYVDNLYHQLFQFHNPHDIIALVDHAHFSLTKGAPYKIYIQIYFKTFRFFFFLNLALLDITIDSWIHKCLWETVAVQWKTS